MEIFGEKKRKRESFGILYTGYPLSIVKIKREKREGRERATKNIKCDLR